MLLKLFRADEELARGRGCRGRHHFQVSHVALARYQPRSSARQILALEHAAALIFGLRGKIGQPGSHGWWSTIIPGVQYIPAGSDHIGAVDGGARFHYWWLNAVFWRLRRIQKITEALILQRNKREYLRCIVSLFVGPRMRGQECFFCLNQRPKTT